MSGNVEFPATVDIVVQENTATNMKAMKAVTGLGKPGAPPAPNIFEQNGGKGLPKRTFKDRMTLFKGPDQIELYYLGRGHTNGDAWVLFPTLRVLTAGDIVSGRTFRSSMPTTAAVASRSATRSQKRTARSARSLIRWSPATA